MHSLPSPTDLLPQLVEIAFRCHSSQDFSDYPFLSDRTAHSKIGYWHHFVVCLSVTLCVVAK